MRYNLFNLEDNNYTRGQQNGLVTIKNPIFKLSYIFIFFSAFFFSNSFADGAEHRVNNQKLNIVKQKQTNGAVNQENGAVNQQESNNTIHHRTYSTDHYSQNDFSVEEEEHEVARLKGMYISPYNYTQNPIAYNMGTSTVAGPDGIYQVGLSTLLSGNIPMNGTNTTFNSNAIQIWGQTGRWNGFALGGTLQGVQVIRQVGQPNTYTPYGVLAPSQAYIDYKKAGVFQITAGNILLSTPWVNSNGNIPGATFANTNNTYLGALATIRLHPSLLLLGFHAYSYLQYPNSFPNAQNFYNTNNGSSGPLPIAANATNMGVTGVGLRWNPSDSYRARLWFYQFVDYANMWYFDNNYHLTLNRDYSMDFGLQALNQSSGQNSITTYTALPGTTAPAGLVSSTGLGLKWAINIPHDTVSFSYNNLFGPSNSYLNGGMLTPYTYGLETDPLYTTPALTSLAELGSGSAYTIRNSLRIIEEKLIFNLSYSQFFTNQVYSGQPNGPITEVDGAVIYNWTKQLNTWTRLVYLDTPTGAMWQPRIIMNYSF